MTDEQRGDQTHDSWELLTRGELSRDEDALLRALADDDGPDSLKLEAHAPLDSAFRERMTQQLAEQIAANKRVTRLRKTRLAAGSLVLAAAAALMLMLRPETVRVPEYALAIEGQVAHTRGSVADAGAWELTPDSRLEVKLTPTTRVGTRLSLSAFLERNGQVIPWAVPTERASSNSFRIQGEARDLLKVEFGEWNAIFVIAPDPVTAVPDPADDLQATTVLRASFRYRTAASPQEP